MEKYSTIINPRGGGVLSYMDNIFMCCKIGYGFCGSQSLKRVSFLPMLV